MTKSQSIHRIEDLFENEEYIDASRDIYDLVMKYIIHPIFREDVVIQANERKKYGISSILEFRIMLNDITNYLNEVKERIESVFSIPMTYEDAKLLLARLSQVYTREACMFFNLSWLIDNSLFYLDDKSKEKLHGYIRLL